MEIQSEQLSQRLNGPSGIRLVAGYFNESLTSSVARSAHPAQYVDINCDLWVSTTGALRWLIIHGLLAPGSVVAYDDWFDTAFLTGGESLAHWDMAHEFRVQFEYLHSPCTGTHFGAVFRVLSIGLVGDPGVSPTLATLSCRSRPGYLPPYSMSQISTCQERFERASATSMRAHGRAPPT